MYPILRFFLFFLSPERAHYTAMRLFGLALYLPGIRRLYHFDGNAATVDGLRYKNRVGMAAGFDKDGKFLDQLYALNFGFVEVGTVTPRPQSGNPKPRLFRLRQDHALINRMGFNNEGIKALKSRLERFRKKERDCDMLIGVNIGKNKSTPNAEAASDYLLCYEALYDLADFFVVNVSSPNTPNLRELQQKEALDGILSPLLAHRAAQHKQKPLYLKIAPDLSFGHLDQIISLQQQIGFDGLVATNTSLDRNLIQFTPTHVVSRIGDGGLSGAPVLDTSNAFVRYIRERSQMTIFGVGGIESAADAIDKREAGADLVEIYTGFIYAGPGLVRAIGTALD